MQVIRRVDKGSGESALCLNSAGRKTRYLEECNQEIAEESGVRGAEKKLSNSGRGSRIRGCYKGAGRETEKNLHPKQSRKLEKERAIESPANREESILSSGEKCSFKPTGKGKKRLCSCALADLSEEECPKCEML